MDETGTNARKAPKHLLTREVVTRSAGGTADRDLTRHHGQSNGLRVHGLYFAVVSVVALVLVIGAIVLAGSMR